jgi:hypothetical protein
MKTRFIHLIGTRAYQRIYWSTDEDKCPNCCGTGQPGFHNAQMLITQSDMPHDHELGGNTEDYPEESWPTVCQHCGKPAPPDHERQIFRKSIYNTTSGDPEPGDMFYRKMHEPGEKCISSGWTNCDGQHLYVVLPNGNHWDVDSRASNCTLKEETTHRCWCRHGEPPNVHVDKNGNTCAAGAGSILSGNYHGFLHNGELT